MYRKRSVKAVPLSVREQETTASILSLLGERGRQEHAMNDEDTACMWCGSQAYLQYHAILSLTSTTSTCWLPGRESNMICTVLNK